MQLERTENITLTVSEENAIDIVRRIAMRMENECANPDNKQIGSEIANALSQLDYDTNENLTDDDYFVSRAFPNDTYDEILEQLPMVWRETITDHVAKAWYDGHGEGYSEGYDEAKEECAGTLD